MKYLSLLAGSAFIALAALPSTALASIDGVVTATTGAVTVRTVSGTRTFDYSSQQIDAANSGIAFTGGGIQSTSRVGPDVVEFQNGIMVGGPGSFATAFTEVLVTFTNTSDKTVTPTLISVLDPLGLGFYVSDLGVGGAGPCTAATLGACAQTSSATFADVGPGFAGFQFEIINDGVSVYTLDGSIVATGDGTIDDSGMALASTELLNFRKSTPLGDPSAFGFQWDLTPITLTLSELAPGESSTLTYLTTTYANVDGPCTNASTSTATCLLAYSAFGDPLKGGTGINNSGSLDFGAFDLLDLENGISGIKFNTLAPLYLPEFDPVTGNLTVFLPTTEDGLIGVPEPASWGLMIAGFGMIGGALRRRRSGVLA